MITLPEISEGKLLEVEEMKKKILSARLKSKRS
jgi:hypothetical protein